MKTSESKSCKCQTNCRTKRCICRKAKEFCDDTCGCKGCDNKQAGSASGNQNVSKFEPVREKTNNLEF